MKLLNYSKLIIILVSSFLILSKTCFSEETSKSRSDLLKEAVIASGRNKTGYSLLYRDSIFRNFVKGLDKKEDIPFLLDVIKNGPDWFIDVSDRWSIIRAHIARCYAVLCLASIKDSQAYPVLIDLLQNGDYILDPNLSHVYNQKAYDIKIYAAAGLGILGDDRAIGLLIANLVNKNQLVADQCANALAKMGDMRVIESMLDAGEKQKIDTNVVGSSLTALTKLHLETKVNLEDINNITVTSIDFPEMGELKSNGNYSTKIWKYWFKNGKNWTKQKFDEEYIKYLQGKSSDTNELFPEYKRNENRNILTKLGVAALPLIIEKIEQGESDLIPLVSQLTDNRIKNDVEVKDVLSWWKANKEKWIIFDYSQE